MNLKLLKFLSEEITEQGYGLLWSDFTDIDTDIQGFNINTGQKVKKGWENPLVSGMGAAGYSEAKANNFLTKLNAHLGKSYEWGKSGPNVFDCSGLVVYVYKEVGFKLNQRVSGPQYDASEKIYDTKKLMPGDLIFFDTPARGKGASSNIDHVGIVVSPLGSEKIDMIHAEGGGGAGSVTRLNDVTRNRFYGQYIFGYGRFPIYQK